MSGRATLQKDRGFSLVDILIYLAIVVLIAAAGVTTFLSLDTVLLRNQTERALATGAEVSLERMLRDIRAATNADTSIAGELTLTAPGTTTVFFVSGGQLILKVNGTVLGPLTPESVTVEDLTFEKLDTTGGDLETELVRVALTLSVSSRAASSTRTFRSGAVLRGSYE